MVQEGRHDLYRLIAALQAARLAGEAAARWWAQIADGAPRVITNQTLDELFRGAMVTMAQALDAHTLSLLLANDTEDELIARASIGLAEEPALALRIGKGEGMAGQVLASRKALIVADLSQIDVVSPGLRDSGLRSVVAVPMVAEGRFLGVLYAGSHELDNFTGVDADILDLLAEHLVSPLARVRSLESERAERKRAERVADRLARLQDITAGMATATTTEQIASVLARSLAADGSRWCGLWLVRDDRIELVRSGAMAPSCEVKGVDVALQAPSPLARSVRDRQPIYLSGVQANQLWQQGGIPDLPPGDRIGVVPLVLRDECLGAVVLIDLGDHEFDSEERDFLVAMVHEIAQGIDRAQLYAEQAGQAKMSAFLAEAAQVLAEAEDFEDTVDRLAGLALGALGDICLIDIIDDDGQIARMVARHRDPTLQHLADRLRRNYPPEPDGADPALDVIRTGETRWAAEVTDDQPWVSTRDEDHLAHIRALEFRSSLAVPLLTGSEVIGALTLVSTSRAFGPEDVAFAERLALQVAAVVGNARHHDAASRTSHVLQQRLLPQRLPEVPGLQVHTRYLPATRGLDVGGDFYDLLVLPSRRIGFLIGDVAGHDSDAAAVMGQLRSAARALAGQVQSPADLIATIQWSWDLIGLDRMATALFGRLDVATGDLILASAGHYPPLLVDSEAARFLPVVPSTPLGAPPSAAANWEGTLRPGQMLLLYTDGVLDERNSSSAHNLDRLAEVAAAGDLHPDAVCARIVEMLPSDRTDDVALLALRLGD